VNEMPAMPYPQDETVFTRTHKGQVVATARVGLMDEPQLALLRMVNGYTAAWVLAGLSGLDLSTVLETLYVLEGKGLIERVPGLSAPRPAAPAG